jgi:sarcosine oxidase subunit beta
MRNSAAVVVIGGGVIGASIAYHLARKGARDIVLLEKNYLASGSTGRCAAGVREQFGTEMNCRLSKKSLEMFENLNEELAYKNDIEFKQKGYLILAYTQKEWDQFKKNVALQQSLGIPSRLVTPYEAGQIVPTMNTQGLLGATFCARDGHCNPFHTTVAYGEAAGRLNVELSCCTTVTGLDVRDGQVWGVTTDKGYIESRTVVIAAGAYSQTIAEMAGVTIPNYAERHQILVTEPVDPVQNPMVISFSRRFYCQQTPRGGFVMGMGDANEPKDFDIGHSWQFLEEVTRVACDIIPSLAEARMVRQWSGLYDMTPDAQPVLGTLPGVSGCYIATGFSGHGFMLGPVTGLVMAEMILGMETSLDVSMLDLGRFERGELIIEPSVV